jgi:hypothetical protein
MNVAYTFVLQKSAKQHAIEKSLSKEKSQINRFRRKFAA